eukprot:30880-Pelagococcus_subviridis.AAC.4
METTNVNVKRETRNARLGPHVVRFAGPWSSSRLSPRRARADPRASPPRPPPRTPPRPLPPPPSPRRRTSMIFHRTPKLKGVSWS